MQRYVIQELSLSIPSQWRDQTINAFVLSSKDGKGEVSLVITRDTDSGCHELNEFADQQMVRTAQKFKNYRLIARSPHKVREVSAIQVDYSWETPENARVQQRQLYLKHKIGFIVFTLTSKANQMDRYSEVWSQVINSILIS